MGLVPYALRDNQALTRQTSTMHARIRQREKQGLKSTLFAGKARSYREPPCGIEIVGAGLAREALLA